MSTLATAWSVVDTAASQDASGTRTFAGRENTERFDGAPTRTTRRAIALPLPAHAQDPGASAGAVTSSPSPVRKELTTSIRTTETVSAPRLMPRAQPRTERFLALQQWEGTVLERRQDAIRVRLVDKTTNGAEEEAEIYLDELSEDDRSLVKPGAVFYWSVGYHDSAAGQRTRQSSIVFRRLPAWTQSELEAIRRKVRKQSAHFGWV